MWEPSDVPLLVDGPLTSEQEAAAFYVKSTTGREIEGRFISGIDDSSYVMTGRTREGGPPSILMFLRNGTDVDVAAGMIRRMADELQQQKAPEGSRDPFTGIKEVR